jgi:mRNA interferase MazF
VIERGDIRWFRFDAPDKRRPVLVLGREDVLPSLSQIPIVPLSTQIRGLRWEVQLRASDGLPSECVLKPEWIKTVDRSRSARGSRRSQRHGGMRSRPRCSTCSVSPTSKPHSVGRLSASTCATIAAVSCAPRPPSLLLM